MKVLAKKQRVLIGGLVIFLLSGCGTFDKKLVENGIPKNGTIIPNVPIRVTPQYTTSLVAVVDKVVAAAVLNYIYQPLDATWDVADMAVSNDTHRISLRMKRFTTGGDGEAWQTAKRYADRLAAAKGASGYIFLEYSSGIDSATPIARRVADGLIRFTDVPPDPSSLPANSPAG